MIDPDLKARMQAILDALHAAARAAAGRPVDYTAIDAELDAFIALAAPRMAESDLTEFLKQQQSLRRSFL